MKNVVILFKTEDGTIYCKEVSEKGIKYMMGQEEDPGYWEEGGTILLGELEEILDKEIKICPNKESSV